MQRFHVLSLLLCALLIGAHGGPEPFDLREGDRVVFLGNAFFERALDHGYMETALALRWPERNVTFRNLGWDGDTVYGHARAGGRRRTVFGDPEEGFARMMGEVRLLEPSVIFLAYGLNESFDDDAGLTPFREGLRRLLKEIASIRTRVILLSPTLFQEGFGADSTYIAQRNEMLTRYSQVIAEAAASEKQVYVDLTTFDQPLPSENGLHLAGPGYRLVAERLTQQLKLPPAKIDPNSEDATAIRAAIVRKNRLYFHRWRPRNDAFVFGERKDEQKIAQTEPAQFEPFIAKQEAVVRQLLQTKS